MIEQLKDLPSHVVGFHATGKVTQDDYTSVVFPAVKELVKRTGELNYLMIIDTSFDNITIGAWWEDTILSLINPGKRHRAAVVTPSAKGNKFTDVWGKIFPGEFRGFLLNEYDEALEWVSK